MKLGKVVTEGFSHPAVVNGGHGKIQCHKLCALMAFETLGSAGTKFGVCDKFVNK